VKIGRNTWNGWKYFKLSSKIVGFLLKHRTKNCWRCYRLWWNGHSTNANEL